MATVNAERPGRWVDRAEAARILDVPPRAVDALVEQGLIGKRDLPVRARFYRQDVESLARCQLQGQTNQGTRGADQ